MTQESVPSAKESSAPENAKHREKKDKNSPPSKVIIRRLPPTMNVDIFMEQISPIPDNDYMYFVKADMSLGLHAFSRAYINFTNQEDIFIFKDKFDGYVFIDQKGNEYPAVVEFAPFQKIPKKKAKKKDSKCGTIETDADYLKFLESLQNPEEVVIPTAESYLEEIEARERELKASNGIPRITTPLIEYIKHKKAEKMRFREEKREERKRRELERKRLRDEERKRRKAEKEKERDKNDRSTKEAKDAASTSATEKEGEKEKSDTDKLKNEPVVKLLKNPEREKEEKDIQIKEKTERSQPVREKPMRPLSGWEKERRRREEERQQQREKQRERDRERKDGRDDHRTTRREDGRQNYGATKYHDKMKSSDDTKGYRDDTTKTSTTDRDDNNRGSATDEKERDRYGRKSDVRPKSERYRDDHQWNKGRSERRWDSDDRYSRRGPTGSKSTYERPGRGYGRANSASSTATKLDASERVPKSEKEKTDQEDVPSTKVEVKSVKENVEEGGEKKKKTETEKVEEQQTEKECENLGSSLEKNVEESTTKATSTAVVADGDIGGDDRKSPDDNKEMRQDPRTERRIRNKDRPSLELYRPGMRRLSVQRNSPQKDVTPGSPSSSSSPSPTPQSIGRTVSAPDNMIGANGNSADQQGEPNVNNGKNEKVNGKDEVAIDEK